MKKYVYSVIIFAIVIIVSMGALSISVRPMAEEWMAKYAMEQACGSSDINEIIENELSKEEGVTYTKVNTYWYGDDYRQSVTVIYDDGHECNVVMDEDYNVLSVSLGDLS